MMATGRRQVQAFDLDAFEDDGGDLDSPGLMNMFVKQNKRVLKIFESDNSDSGEQNENQSYGLRLISRSDGQDEEDSSPGHSPTSHNAEEAKARAPGNAGKQNQQTSQLNVRNLSPIDIVTLSSEDVSEHSASPRRESQRVSTMSRLRSRPNQSLRRSLFSEHFPPSSTPLALTRKANGNVFKDAFDSILSPIKQMQPKEATAPKAIQLHSFKQIEQDLEQMYGLKETRTSPKPPAPTEPCVVQLDKMQVEEVATTKDHSQRENGASEASNRTNFNHCSMIETPIVHRNDRQQPECHDELAQRLKVCETTSDESAQKSTDNIESMQTEGDAVVLEVEQNAVNTNGECSSTKTEDVGNTTDPNSQPAASNTNDFEENRAQSESSRTCNDSISKTLDPDVIKSFRNLSKRPLTQDQPQLKESFKFAQPKRRKAATGTVSSSTAKYLDMTKQKPAKKTKATRAATSRKRTLYSQQDEDDSNERVSSSQQILTVGKANATTEEAPESGEIDGKQQRNEKKPLRKKKRSAATSSGDSDEEKEDEGFDSEDFHESYDDIRYDPYERGCQRPGLRVRRFANPYWINNGTAKNYAITYGAMTKKQCKDEEKLARIGRASDKKAKIPKSGSATVSNAFASPKQARQRKFRSRTAASKKAENAASKTSEIESTKNDQSTAKSAYSFSSVVQAIASSKKTESSVVRESYNLAPIKSVQFRDCGEGLYFGAFIDGKADGIIKLIPGGRKKLARSKYSSLKFFVLEGCVDITCNNESLKLERFGFLDINANYYYALSNSSDQDVFIQFTRFDRRRE